MCFVANSLYHRGYSSWRLKVPERMVNIPSENGDIEQKQHKKSMRYMPSMNYPIRSFLQSRYGLNPLRRIPLMLIKHSAYTRSNNLLLIE